MLIFIDETGDLGFDFCKQGTSPYFVTTALVLAGQQDRRGLETAVSRTISRKINVGKKGKKRPTQELKGRKTDLSVKCYFWEQAKAVLFRLYTLVVNKREVAESWRRRKGHLYNYLARQLVEKIPLGPGLSSVHVEIDKSKGAREREEFNASLKPHIQGRIPLGVSLSIFHMLSEQSRGVQAADMFSWGVARKYTSGDQSWYDIFSSRIACEEVFQPAPPLT